MAEKIQQVNTRGDEESLQMKEEKRKKRMKWAAYIAAFAVFQTIVILVFVLVVMRVHRPKFRISSFEIQTLSTNTQTPSFDMSFIAPVRVKNTNFGPYKYDATTVDFMYGDLQVGQVAIPKSKASFKSTKKINANVTLSSAALTSTSNLGSELNSGVLTLSSQGAMNGKVELMFIFKKKKSTNMNCTMEIDVSAKTLKSISCK